MTIEIDAEKAPRLLQRLQTAISEYESSEAEYADVTIRDSGDVDMKLFTYPHQEGDER